MGTGSSKAAAAAPSGGDRRARLRGSRVFNSSCFGLPPTVSDDQVVQQVYTTETSDGSYQQQQREEENGRSKGKTCAGKGGSISSGGNHEACRKLRLPRPNKITSLTSSDPELSVKEQAWRCEIDSGASSSSTTTTVIGRSSNPSSRLCSRFGFKPDGIGFRLSRAISLGSSGARTHFSANLLVPNSDAGDHVCIGPGSPSDDRNGTEVNTSTETISSQDVVRNDASIEATITGLSHRNHAQTENLERRRSSRRLGPQESVEGSVRFGRTLSVGRLRDRVLRGTSLSEGLFGSAPLEERSVAYIGLPNGRRVFGSSRRAPSSSDTSNEVLPDSSNNRTYHRSNSMDSSYDQESETPQLREASNHDLVEHRSSFLERRRRIRSQVRALQRLGRRFENLSGHDRSCVLSGQHRTGRCTCRMSNRPANPDDDISTRTSISRIVMLAEALFEVLDEIHQQSVVLSSRPSLSSIGSVPAPKEVVECMPVKVYMKQHKYQKEETEQCYICLVECEEGDCMRVLPCNHEFHQMCIDKWLKEIHRVCPLCRGDVCIANASSMVKT